MAQGAADSAAS
uniref:Uncharacterized protein n=1 Tax=Arundo donax TaxID=35708 RepID=A0A0A8YXB4_ARUDO